MKKLALTVLLLAISLVAFAEDVVIKGVVTDDTGETLPGVSVVVLHQTIGTLTDIDGKYQITVPQGSKTLVFNLIGMTKKEVDVPNTSSVVDVVLQSQNVELEEVVVTGYGTFKKSAYAGSASTVKMTDMEDVPALDFSTMLQGNAPGVQINSSSGQPGSSTSIMIRGMGSFNASTSPLYVVDGVPVMSGNLSSTDAGMDVMSTISPSDIENITVIKDAAAASLYGSRAANGVVLITTKSGKAGKPSIKLKADWGFSDYSLDYRPIMGGAERRELIMEGLRNQAIDEKNLTGEPAIQQWVNNNINALAPIPANGYTNWEKELFRKGSHKNYEVSASGGDNKLSYYTSLGFTDQEGITYQSAFERISGRLNVKYKFTPKFELGANVLYSKVKQDVSSEGGTYTSPIYATRHKVTPSDAVYNEDGSFNENLIANDKRNPKATSLYNYRKMAVDRSTNVLFGNYKFYDDLLLHSTLSYDVTDTKSKSWDDPRTSDGAGGNGNLSTSIYKYRHLVWKTNATYTKTIGELHNLDALAGYEIDVYSRDYLSSSKSNFPNPESGEISNGAELKSSSGYKRTAKIVSYLSRINYNYADKYFLGASARVDGSSKLHADSRWGTFWSVSGAWRFIEEDFMKSTQSVLTDAKIRASYGSNGTLPGDYYGYMNLYSYGYNYQGIPGIRETQIADKNLKWEKNNNLNLGIDFRFLNRFGLTVEYYKRVTSDLLMDLPISGTVGIPGNSYLTNVGKVENSGIEVDINADILTKTAVSWRSTLNVGHNQNKIKSLGGQDEIRSGVHVRRVGEAYNSFFVAEFAGINPDTGIAEYYVNKEGGDPKEKTTDGSKANRILYKQAEPKLTGGWTNTLKYKFVDMSFTTTFSLGGYSYDNAAQKLDHGGSAAEHNIQTYYRDRWKNPGDNAKYEKFVVGNRNRTNGTANSRSIHSTDHIRLKNITFGLNVPKKMIQKVGLGNMRVYFSAVNLLTFAKYDKYDPEVSPNGVVYFESPKLKTLTFGVDIKF